MNRAAAPLAFLIVFGVAVTRVCPTIFPDDTPETVLAAATLGISHPPGDAPLALAGKAWSAIPLGNPALRLNLLSAALGAGAAVLLARLALVLTPAGPGTWVVMPAAVLAFLFNPLLVQQMAVAKGATYMLNFVLVLGAFLALARSRPLSAALLLGILASHHWMTFAVLLPAFLAVGIPFVRSGNAARRILLVLAVFTLGTSLWLAMPVRAAARPALNWGDVSTFARFRAHLTRQAYLGTELKGGAESWKRQAGEGIRAVGRQAGWSGIVLAAAGMAGLAAVSRPALLVGLAAGLAPWLASVFYLDLRGDLMYLLGVFLLPTWLVLSFFGAAGAGFLAGQKRRALALLAAVLLACTASFQYPRLAPYDASRTTWSFDLGRALLSPLPQGAGLCVASDLDTFPLWYFQGVEGFRADILVANQVIMRHSWYRAALGRASGVRRLADLIEGDRALGHLVLASGRPWFTAAGPVPGIPDGLVRVPFHLSFRLSPEPGRGTYPRAYPMRAFTERVAHLPEPTAAYSVGYCIDAFTNLGMVPGRK